MNKEKKNIILIVIGVILVIVLMCFVVATIVEKNSNVETTKLQDILNDSLEIKTFIDSEKNIELISFSDEKNTDNIKIWAFSEPVYLGEFKLVKKDNKYYLEGLNDILKQKDLNVGTHRLLMMQSDKSLGYIKIEIDNDKSLKSTLLNDNGENTNSNETTNESNSNDNNTSISNANKNQTDKTETNKNTNITDNKKDETTKSTNNVQEESKEDEPKQEETKCTPKKFKNKYTYVFENKNTCVKSGDQIDAWNYFRANGIPATVYGCEEIVDECGNTYYGVYYGNTEGERFYY